MQTTEKELDTDAIKRYLMYAGFLPSILIAVWTDEQMLILYLLICAAVGVVLYVAGVFEKQKESGATGENKDIKPTERKEKVTMPRQEMIFDTIKAIGCQPSVTEEGRIDFAYQGENFVVLIDSAVTISIYDSCWLSMEKGNPDLPLLKEAVNSANLRMGNMCTIVYTYDDEEDAVNVHTKCRTLFEEIMTDRTGYLRYLLGCFFEMKDVLRQSFFQLKNEAAPGKNESFTLDDTHVPFQLWCAVMDDFDSKWLSEDSQIAYASVKECREFIRRLNEQTGRKYSLVTQWQWDAAGKQSYDIPRKDYVHVYMYNRKEMSTAPIVNEARGLDIPSQLICSMGNGHDAFVLYLAEEK